MSHKLLLADDSVTIQRVIELTFADEDVEVIAVGDGKQAINRAQQDPPDIILADVGMPERDGYEVATFVKQTPELKHIPVLLLTGAFEPIDEGRARAAGCDGVLVKPFEPQLVINRVKDLISGRRAPATAAPEAPPSEPQAPAAPAQSVAVELPPDPAPAAAARPAPETAPPVGSIEDYFDRLDAAFSSLDTGPVLDTPPAVREIDDAPPPAAGDSAPAFGGLGDALAGWDPDLSIEAARTSVTLELPPPIDLGWGSAPAPVAPPAHETPAPILPAAAPSAPAAASPPAAFSAPAGPPPAPPSLAEAFAALLAAEQGRPFSPPALHRTPTAPAVDDRVVDEVARRVLDRMSDRVVKDTVADMAERMVREEIERIKSSAR
jgi:CheY-like chemotaxis protein